LRYGVSRAFFSGLEARPQPNQVRLSGLLRWNQAGLQSAPRAATFMSQGLGTQNFYILRKTKPA